MLKRKIRDKIARERLKKHREEADEIFREKRKKELAERKKIAREYQKEQFEKYKSEMKTEQFTSTQDSLVGSAVKKRNILNNY